MKFLVLFILAISTLVTCIPALPKGIQTHSNAFALAAFSKALELGIDPAGQHPSDYIEDNGKVITFKAGSKFALWVAAQGARTDKAALEKRDSEMVITSRKRSIPISNGYICGDGMGDIMQFRITALLTTAGIPCIQAFALSILAGRGWGLLEYSNDMFEAGMFTDNPLG
ncbi:hypothetical protein K440DRAFT_646204 [Wilcoxina mikolae CBS 423.85]|nr:hypothetical protein K440DRAFT_646204 [Wilcoxina mikolae CBS 423.85]